MKSVPVRSGIASSSELDRVLVTEDELKRFYGGVGHVDSNAVRYNHSYEEGLEAARKVVELLESEAGITCNRAIERASERIGWMASIFCRICLRSEGNPEVIELSPNQVYVFGSLADKVALTMHINERIAQGTPRTDIKVLLDQAKWRNRLTYLQFDNWTEFMEERTEPPAYALIRTQTCLFIERLAYEDLYQKERKNLVRFVKAIPGIYVLLEPK